MEGLTYCNASLDSSLQNAMPYSNPNILSTILCTLHALRNSIELSNNEGKISRSRAPAGIHCDDSLGLDRVFAETL